MSRSGTRTSTDGHGQARTDTDRKYDPGCPCYDCRLGGGCPNAFRVTGCEDWVSDVDDVDDVDEEG